MDNPFEKYFAVNRNGAYFVDNIYRPEMTFRETDFALFATVRNKEHPIYDLKDVILSEGKLGEGTKANFKGLISERILSVLLEELIDDSLVSLKVNQPGSNPAGGVLREKEEHVGKEFVATYNSHYLLKYKGKSNFVVLKKTPLNTPSAWYQQEKSGLQASEIDGLAYLHADSRMYLIIGESKTISSWDNIDYEEFHNTLGERIITPFKALFPAHELIFFFLGKEGILFDNGSKLKPKPAQLTELLGQNNVKTIFSPLPQMPRSIEEYAEDMFDALPMIRETLKIFEKMI